MKRSIVPRREKDGGMLVEKRNDYVRITIFLFVFLFGFFTPNLLFAWTPGLREAAEIVASGKNLTEHEIMFVFTHQDEINLIAIKNPAFKKNIYPRCEELFIEKNNEYIQKVAEKFGVEANAKPPKNGFNPGRDTDIDVVAADGETLTLKKIKSMDRYHQELIREDAIAAGVEYEGEAGIESDYLPNPDCTTDEQFEKTARYINEEKGGTAYRTRKAARAELKIAKGESLTPEEVSIYSDEMQWQSKRKSNKIEALAEELQEAETANSLPQVQEIEAKIQLVESQQAKYIKRVRKLNDLERMKYGFEPARKEITGVESAIDIITESTAGRGAMTAKEAQMVGKTSESAMAKAQEALADTLIDAGKHFPSARKTLSHVLKDLPPSSQSSLVKRIEKKIGVEAANEIVQTSRSLRQAAGSAAEGVATAEGMQLKAVMSVGTVILIGHTGVEITLHDVKPDDTLFDYFKNVYKNSLWYGTGVGAPYEKAEKEEIEMMNQELSRGEERSFGMHTGRIIVKTGMYMGKDVVVGLWTLPDVLVDAIDDYTGANSYKYAEAQNELAAALQLMIMDKKRFRNELERLKNHAKKAGLHNEDMKAFIDCMCKSVGNGMLGSRMDPKKGCLACGPLNCWPVPLETSESSVLHCVNQVDRENYAKSQSVFKELKALDEKTYQQRRKLIEDENASRVAPKLRQIKTWTNSRETLVDAAKTFLDIKDWLPKKERDRLEAEISSKLWSSAFDSMYKGEMDRSVESLRWSHQIKGEEYEKDEEFQRFKRWQKNWNEARSKTFPEIRENIENGKLVAAQSMLRQLDHDMLNGNRLPEAESSPEYKELVKKYNAKTAEYDSTYNETMRKTRLFENSKDPRSAVSVLQGFIDEWQHEPGRKGELTRRLARDKELVHKAEEDARAGDMYAENHNYPRAVESYKGSLLSQKDSLVEAKLEQLSKRSSTGREILAEGQKEDRSAVLKTKQEQPDKTRKLAEDQERKEARDKTGQEQRAAQKREQVGSGYWQFVEEKGSIGRECTPQERYNDYYRDTVSGFNDHVKITKMVREANRVYCEMEGAWKRPAEKLYPGTALELPVSINRLADTGEYSCNMEVYFDTYDMECGASGAGGDIGGVTLDRKGAGSIQKTISWKVKEPSQPKEGERLTIRACYNAQAAICGKNQGMKYYYRWVSAGSPPGQTADSAETKGTMSRSDAETNTISEDSLSAGKVFKRSRGNPVSVKNGTDSLKIPCGLFEPGEQIAVSFTASPNYPEKSWIGMFPADLPHDGMEKNNNHELAFQYLEKSRKGEFTFTSPTEEGAYDFRMFERGSGKEVATIGFAVAVNKEAASLELPKNLYEPDEQIALSFTASPNYPEKSWIGMFPADLPHDGMEKNNNRELAFQYLEKSRKGEFTFTSPTEEGAYDFRMFERSNGKEVSTIGFTVAVNKEAASLKLPKNSYGPGEQIALSFTASPNYPEKSWIGMFRADLPHDGMEKNNNHELAFQYLEKSRKGEFTFTSPTEKGAYDFRMFERSNGKEVAAIGFAVSADNGK